MSDDRLIPRRAIAVIYCAVRHARRSGRLPRSVIALSGLLIAVAACGSPESAPSTTTTTGPSAAATTTAQAAAPARITRADLPAHFGLRRNATTVFSGCGGNFGSAPESVTVFDTDSGKFQQFPIPQPPSGEELVNQACTVTTVRGKPRAIFVVTTKRPSVGLTPESEHTQIHAYDIGNPTPQTVDWPASLPIPRYTSVTGAAFRSIAPIDGGFLAIGGSYADNLVASFDASTLALTSSKPAFEGHGGQLDHNFDGYAITYRGDVHLYNGIDGSEVGRFPDLGSCGDGSCLVPVDHGFVLTRDKAGGIFYFDMLTKQLRGPLDVLAGPPVGLFDTSHKIYPDNNVTVLSRGAQYGDSLLFEIGGALTVYDTATDTMKFSLSKDKFSALNVQEVDLGGQFLYLTKDPDNPVIDYTTSNTVSAGWKIRPVLKLPDGWALLQPSRTDDHDPAPYLARGKDGDYDGPWF